MKLSLEFLWCGPWTIDGLCLAIDGHLLVGSDFVVVSLALGCTQFLVSALCGLVGGNDVRSEFLCGFGNLVARFVNGKSSVPR